MLPFEYVSFISEDLSHSAQLILMLAGTQISQEEVEGTSWQGRQGQQGKGRGGR